VFDGIDSQDVIDAAVGYNFRLPEPLAALGYAQIQKVELLNGIRKKNYRALADGLSRFSFLKLAKNTNDDGEFTPYCVGLTFTQPGISRNTFAEALRAEGIPVATGFPRLLNENPYTREDVSHTPNAKALNDEKYLAFFQVGNPNTPDDMQDIVRAVAKLEQNFGELARLNDEFSRKREYTTGR
ncbi:MAG: DegT/DnrJ/EryC1/StrS family aminotransferase, partial [Deltaproteobacteria bacterium]|nr:DegT/DnrJ/EryC1/StrS family aminotransferase [Deltaproteobacteria bacterium]